MLTRAGLCGVADDLAEAENAGAGDGDGRPMRRQIANARGNEPRSKRTNHRHLDVELTIGRVPNSFRAQMEGRMPQRPQDAITNALNGFFAAEGRDMTDQMKGALVSKLATACAVIQGDVDL